MINKSVVTIINIMVLAFLCLPSSEIITEKFKVPCTQESKIKFLKSASGFKKLLKASFGCTKLVTVLT